MVDITDKNKQVEEMAKNLGAESISEGINWI